MKGIAKNGVALSLGLFFLCYQLLCLTGGRALLPRVHWSQRFFPGLALPVIRYDTPKGATDSASRMLSGIGYLLRYGSGEIPDLLLVGRSRGKELELTSRGGAEFQLAAYADRIRQHLVPPLSRFVKYLTGRGVQVIVLPVPTKLSILRERFPIEDAGPEDSYGVYRAVIEAAPRHTVDLYREFTSFRRKHPLLDLFPPADYHWSSLGVALGSVAAIRKLKELGLAARDPSVQRTEGMAPPYLSLMDYFQIPAYLRHLLRFPEGKAPLYRITEAKMNGARGRIILLGTSFSGVPRVPGFSLGELLASSLRRELHRFAFDAAGVWGGLRLLEEKNFMLRRGDLLVLEFPIYRALDVPVTAMPLVEEGLKKPAHSADGTREIDDLHNAQPFRPYASAPFLSVALPGRPSSAHPGGAAQVAGPFRLPRQQP